jgi:hypothetical protein
MTTSSNVATALRRLATALESMSDEELTRLNEPGAEIEIKVVRRRSKEEVAPIVQIDLADIIAKLALVESRADASMFLKQNFGTRKILEQIARSLDVVVLKQDKTEILRDRIIEATVGARLRSDAIQGNN